MIDPEDIRDPDAPDLTDRDFALARRADGSLLDPAGWLRVRLREVVDGIGAVDREVVGPALSRTKDVIRDLERA